MYLTRRLTPDEPRLALDGVYLPPHPLPPELQENPNGRMWRPIDREWSQNDV